MVTITSLKILIMSIAVFIVAIVIISTNTSTKPFTMSKTHDNLLANKTINEGVYKLKPVHATTKCLDLSNSKLTKGTRAQISSDKETSTQKWKIVSAGNGYYKLLSQASKNMALDVSGSSNAKGAKVQIWNDNNTNAQKWKFLDASNECYMLEPACAPGKYLNVEGASTKDGANLITWTNNKGNNQKWQLIPIKSITPEATLIPSPSPRASNPPTETNLDSITPEQFGAVGDGKTDDTKAMQKAFDSLGASKVLVLSEGKTYVHSNVLRLTKANSHVTGSGTLLATNEQLSAIRVDADNITLDGGLHFVISRTTQRWMANEQMKVHVEGHTGFVAKNITIDGSAAAGVFLHGASQFTLDNITVKNTRADGIHFTGGSHDGTLTKASVTNTGDDGVAVVSYKSDKAICHNITINSPSVGSNTHGRGISVVGGDYITYNDARIDSSNAAAIYIANEGDPYYTYGSSNVTVQGAEISNANTNAQTDHGAVLIYSAQKGVSVSNVKLSKIKITNTRKSASRQVGIISDGGAVSNILFENFTISGGSNTTFYSQAPASAYTRTGWIVNTD